MVYTCLYWDIWKYGWELGVALFFWKPPDVLKKNIKKDGIALGTRGCLGMFCHQTSGFTQTCLFLAQWCWCATHGQGICKPCQLTANSEECATPINVQKNDWRIERLSLLFQRGVAFDLHSGVWTIPISVLIAYMFIFVLAESSFVGCYQPHTVTHHIPVDHVLLISPILWGHVGWPRYRCLVPAPCILDRARVASVAFFFFCTSTTVTTWYNYRWCTTLRQPWHKLHKLPSWTCSWRCGAVSILISSLS